MYRYAYVQSEIMPLANSGDPWRAQISTTQINTSSTTISVVGDSVSVSFHIFCSFCLCLCGPTRWYIKMYFTLPPLVSGRCNYDFLYDESPGQDDRRRVFFKYPSINWTWPSNNKNSIDNHRAVICLPTSYLISKY